MKHCYLLTLFLILLTMQTNAQHRGNTGLPFYEIPDYPDMYTPQNVAARMIDGLGYRFYWATEGLRESDLAYKPSDEARTTLETVAHIYNLSTGIAKSMGKKPIMRSDNQENLAFQELRRRTLENLKRASDILKSPQALALDEYPIIFQQGDNLSEFPFWNLVNGPIADAIYHTGQIVSFRRSSGNPMDGRVNVFTGRNRE